MFRKLRLKWNRWLCMQSDHRMIFNSDKYRVLMGRPEAWCSRCDYVQR